VYIGGLGDEGGFNGVVGRVAKLSGESEDGRFVGRVELGVGEGMA